MRKTSLLLEIKAEHFEQSLVCGVSTAHISRDDASILDKYSIAYAHPTDPHHLPCDHPLVILKYDEGWLINVSDLPGHDEAIFNLKEIEGPLSWLDACLELGHTPSFCHLVELATSRGFQWLNLDADAEKYAWLTSFRWADE